MGWQIRPVALVVAIRGLRCLLPALVWAAWVPPAGAGAAQLGLRIPVLSQTEQLEWDLLAAINRERAAANLPPLTLSSPISRLGRAHSNEMAGQNALSHESAIGSLTDRLLSGGVPFLSSAENLGQGQAADAALLHRAVMDRDGQRANILNAAFDQVGIGVIRGADSFFVTEDFIETLLRMPDAEVRGGILRALNEAREAKRQPAIASVADADLAADDLASDLAAGDTIEVPTSPGSARLRTAKGQDLNALVSALLAADDAVSTGVGVGVVFRQTDEYPGGAYFICALFVSAP